MSILCNIKNESFFIPVKERITVMELLEYFKFKNNWIFKLFKWTFSKIIYYGDSNKFINKVAVLGSGAFGIEEAILQGCDLYISSDFKYHDIQKGDWKWVKSYWFRSLWIQNYRT